MKLTANLLSFSISKLKLRGRILDKLGIFLSVLCGIHCLLTPFLLMVMPWLSHSFESDVFHLVMLVFILPVAGLSILQSNGLKSRPVKMMILGIFLLFLGVIYHFNEHSHRGEHTVQNYLVENLLTITGGAFLFYAHYSKLKSCKSLDSY